MQPTWLVGYLRWTTYRQLASYPRAPAAKGAIYCTFVPLLLLLMTHHEKTWLKALP